MKDARAHLRLRASFCPILSNKIGVKARFLNVDMSLKALFIDTDQVSRVSEYCRVFVLRLEVRGHRWREAAPRD